MSAGACQHRFKSLSFSFTAELKLIILRGRSAKEGSASVIATMI